MFSRYLSFFFNPELVADNEADLMAIKDDMEFYYHLLNNFASAKIALRSPKCIARLTCIPFYNLGFTNFKFPIEGVPQSSGTLFAALCRYHVEIALLVLSHKVLSTQLHDGDIHWIWHSDVGDRLAEHIQEKRLEANIDPRFVKLLSVAKKIYAFRP